MTQTISESLVQPLQLGGPIDHPADADALLQGLVIPPINQEHSKSYVLQAAMNRVQLHRQEAALARDRYQRSLQFVHKSKLDYQRREDTLNQALAAYAYFEHMLPTSAESPSLLAMNTPPSHEMKQAQPPFIYYTSSGMSPSFQPRYSHTLIPMHGLRCPRLYQETARTASSPTGRFVFFARRPWFHRCCQQYWRRSRAYSCYLRPCNPFCVMFLFR
ncbi:hypothetical protein FIBSPDRAFT_148419 [Athelia psychrophila]|uniref:Uncharacterized protein n=1 Tax=Athelia psychrophila TaxID=1759441 RepID=A0A167SMA8_9AGAM|nr:hypothetical protein FIBSPDRAFT_148419 [Fibularhizoctonia sp. CBS 109695]